MVCKMDSIGGKVVCSIKGAVTRGIMLCLILCAATQAWADGESLEETGGYVRKSTALLAFKDITLDDLGTTYLIRANVGGGYIDEAPATLCCRSEERTGEALTKVKYSAHYYDGTYVKAVNLVFTNGAGGVYVQAEKSKYSSTASDILTDFTGTDQSVAESIDAAGYGVYNLKRVSVTEIDSININFKCPV